MKTILKACFLLQNMISTKREYNGRKKFRQELEDDDGIYLNIERAKQV